MRGLYMYCMGKHSHTCMKMARSARRLEGKERERREEVREEILCKATSFDYLGGLRGRGEGKGGGEEKEVRVKGILRNGYILLDDFDKEEGRDKRERGDEGEGRERGGGDILCKGYIFLDYF